MKWIGSFLLLSLVLISLNYCVSAEKRHKPIQLKRATTWLSFDEGGVKRQELIGDVWIVQDSLSVTCYKATYYPDSGILIFEKNVEFRDPRRTLLADRVVYNEYTEEVLASSFVRVYEDTISVTARRARYLEGLKQGYLFDDVRAKDNSRNLVLTGQYGFIDHDKKYVHVTGDPVLVERDSTLKIVTEVHGDTIEYFGEVKQARVSSNVIVTREGLVAMGNRLDYFTKDRMAELIGEPDAVKDQDELKGDTMRLYFEKEKLSKVEVIGHAVATSPADSGKPEPRNRMDGKRITMWIENSKLTKTIVEGNAVATYYIREKGNPSGLNETSGDRLHVFFDQGKISRIRVDGGTEGKYTPQKLMAKKP